MKGYQVYPQKIIPWVLMVFVLLAHEGVKAQPYTLQCDGISSTAGHWSTPNLKVTTLTGQSFPLKPSGNGNNTIVPGFIWCINDLTTQITCPGNVSAGVTGPATFNTGDEIEVELFINMSNSPAPNDKLGSFSGTLRWDPLLLNYANDSGLRSGFTGVVNTTDISNGLLEFNGVNPVGASANVDILSIAFDVAGNAGENGLLDLNYSDILTADTFLNLLPCLTTDDSPFTINDVGPCLVCGDVDSDSTASSSDALILLSYDVGIDLPSTILQKIVEGCGDVDGDDQTGSSDALIILSYDAGIDVPFPVGNSGGCSSSSSVLKADILKADGRVKKDK